MRTIDNWVKTHNRANVIYEDTCQKLYWYGFQDGDWDAYYTAIEESHTETRWLYS